MYYVYVIQSRKDKQFYTGFTRDLQNRIQEHNTGRVPSTKERGPFELIYYLKKARKWYFLYCQKSGFTFKSL